jgi:putative membrane protein
MSELATARNPAAFYRRPFLWLLFALLVFLVPAIGYMADAAMSWGEIHPAINALLNGSSAVFLIVGWFAIRRGNVSLHRQCMIAAFTASTVFLASYLLRFYLTGSHRYPGDGWDRLVYLGILTSHMVLAAAAVPLAIAALALGLRGRFDRHRRLARWTWPIWIYVSITGVIVYLMLYPIAGAVYGTR